MEPKSLFYFLSSPTRWTTPAMRREKVPIPGDEDYEDSASDSTLLGEPRYLRKKGHNWFWSPLKFSFTFLAGLMLGAVLVYSIPNYQLVRGLDIPTPVPDEIFSPRIKVPFVPDSRYYGSGESVDKGWKELTRAGNEIWIQDPSQYDLVLPGVSDPKNKEDPDKRFYVLSNIHQLHCLNIVRMRFRQFEAREGLPVNESEALHADWTEHTDHCFEYLRLSIMCGDFMVMEPDSPPDTPAELTAGGLGWGVVHDCINFDALLQWQADQRRAFDDRAL